MLLGNYIRIAWRNLRSKALYSGIKIGGLAIGLCVCILILLYMSHELSYDKWHKDSDRIYLLNSKLKMDHNTIQLSGFNYLVAPTIKEQNESVESFLRLAKNMPNGVIIQPIAHPELKANAENLFFSDPNFFTFFSFHLLEGSKEEVLKQPFSVVISERIARKFFNKTSAVGKQLLCNGKYPLTVTGIMEDAPSNSSIRPDYLVSANSMKGIDKIAVELDGKRINEGNFNIYLKLKNSNRVGEVTDNFTKQLKAEGDEMEGLLKPLASLQKESSPNFRYLGLFPLVAGLVLLMALINYMSLSTARAIGRAKEIAVRKTLGANYKHIAWQFYVESGLYAMIAFLLALVLVGWLNRPLFTYLDIQIDNKYLFQPIAVLIYLGLLVITVLLAGSYPAFILSRYNAVTVKPSVKDKNIRKMMTITQFTVAAMLIVCCVIIREQLNFFKHSNTGIETDRILTVQFEESMGPHFQTFRQRVAEIRGIESVGVANSRIFEGESLFFLNQDTDKPSASVAVWEVGPAMMEMIKLKWVLPPVSEVLPTAPKPLALNETAVKYLKLGDHPIGKIVRFGGGERQVIGVLKDFNFRSLHQAIAPMGLFIDNDDSKAWGQYHFGFLFVKLGPGQQIPAILSEIKKIYEQFDPYSPFRYKFVDESFNQMYRAEDQLKRLFDIFTMLTVLIAASGLLGLATFSAELRTKEVGIRKVLGANVSQVVVLLSKEFIKLVLVSLVIAIPVAWYLSKKWLQQFAYRTEMKWWMFAVSAALVLTVAIIAVGGQVLKSALRNPIKSLKITSD